MLHRPVAPRGARRDTAVWCSGGASSWGGAHEGGREERNEEDASAQRLRNLLLSVPVLESGMLRGGLSDDCIYAIQASAALS